MKKVNVLKKCILLALIGCSITAHAQQPSIHVNFNGMPTSNEVIELVKSELPNTLQLIAPEDLEQYGFGASDDFSNITTGMPCYQAMSTPDMFLNSTLQLNPYSISVPLVLNNTARCLVHVSFEDNAWRVVGIGDALWVKQQQDVFLGKYATESDRMVMLFAPNQSQNYLIIGDASYSFKPLFAFENVSDKAISWNDIVALQSASPKDLDYKEHTLDPTEINPSK